ncbi:unknown [Fusobacterium sp. CAG:439]|nr:unknown [Fusobacterium sp. CAG:439]
MVGNSVLSIEKQKEKIATMKWLLNFEDIDTNFSAQNLGQSLSKRLNRNFAGLIPLIEYFNSTPQFIQNDFSKMIDVKDDKDLFNKFYDRFKLNLQNNPQYKKFDNLILSSSIQAAIYCDEFLCTTNLKEANKAVFENDILNNILLFNIVSEVCNDIWKFEHNRNIVLNFHLLYYWSKQNKNKPIENLTDDECKIIIALIAGLPDEEILEGLNLQNTPININYIYSIFKSLPEKFHVTNLTQVIFRILLLNPDIWTLPTIEKMLFEIKNISRIICD